MRRVDTHEDWDRLKWSVTPFIGLAVIFAVSVWLLKIVWFSIQHPFSTGM